MNAIKNSLISFPSQFPRYPKLTSKKQQQKQKSAVYPLDCDYKPM